MTTPKMSLTDFLDIVHKSGTPKATKVKQVKERPEYQPAFDFYKPLRESIVGVHHYGHSKATLKDVLGTLTDPKKIGVYPALVTAYAKWWGTKDLAWFSPPQRTIYSHGAAEVFINPELGLEWKGTKHVIKLYFKEPNLSKARVTLILDLLEHTLRSELTDDTKIAVLDVRKSKLFIREDGAVTVLPLVNAELAYIAALWPAI